MQHSIRLDGKTALVTGASSGLGWRFAEVLAQAGAASRSPRAAPTSWSNSNAKSRAPAARPAW